MSHGHNDHGDDFYREIARFVEAHPRRFGWELAVLYDVPSTTAHRWVKEARRRGLLEPSKQSGGTCTICGQPGDAHPRAADVGDARNACIVALMKRVDELERKTRIERA